jgi:SAM-dependent methyltransferase
MGLHRLALAILFCFSSLMFAQKPEYDFYSDFRDSASTQHAQNPSVTPEKVREAYAARLKREGVPEAEIERQIGLLATEGTQLEADRRNRFYKNSQSNYNQEPNGFLMQVVAGRRPGVALDYAMGTGRNALYLAKLGWKVYGFDESDAAVAIAQKRAQELGLTLNTAAVPDSGYDFGKERFDLILFSWAMPLVDAKKAVDALKPGGMVVMECAANYVGRNGMLKMFDALRIERYEIVRATADFYERQETDVLRMIATKP